MKSPTDGGHTEVYAKSRLLVRLACLKVDNLRFLRGFTVDSSSFFSSHPYRVENRFLYVKIHIEWKNIASHKCMYYHEIEVTRVNSLPEFSALVFLTWRLVSSPLLQPLLSAVRHYPKVGQILLTIQ